MVREYLVYSYYQSRLAWVVIYRNVGEILGKNPLHSTIQSTRVLNREPLEM